MAIFAFSAYASVQYETKKYQFGGRKSGRTSNNLAHEAQKVGEQ